MPVSTPRHRRREHATETQPVPETPTVQVADLHQLTKKDLKEVCRLRGVSTSGSKTELIQRLEA